MNALLAFLSNPKALTIIEGVGHAIVTFAQHNQTLLGAKTQSAAEGVGTAVEEAGAVASGLSAFKSA